MGSPPKIPQMPFVRPQIRNSRAKFPQANNLLAFLPHTGGF